MPDAVVLLSVLNGQALCNPTGKYSAACTTRTEIAAPGVIVGCGNYSLLQECRNSTLLPQHRLWAVFFLQDVKVSGLAGAFAW